MNNSLTLWFVFALLSITAIDAAAQQDAVSSDQPSGDRVWLQPLAPDSQDRWYPGAVQVIDGRVIDFDATQLRIIKAGEDSETLIAATRVLWIQPSDLSELEQESIRLYQADEYAESLAKLPEILRQRPAVWRQQWITMLAANAAWKSGRGNIALELVAQLDRRPLPPIVTAWLPIAWRSGVQSAGVVQEAKKRLSDPSPAVQLVAASWLLSSPERRQASSVLRKLATHSREGIARSATALLWRIAPPPQVIDSARQWEKELQSLPMVLQTGPTQTLADRFRTAGLADDADRLQWSIELVPIHPFP